MSGKVIVCRCEDVTLHDLDHTLARGYRDIEEVKRYTGFGTGPCQGKECLRVVACLLAERTGAAPATLAPFTTRPPIAAVPLRLLAGPGAEDLKAARDDDATDGDHGMAG